MFKSISSPSHIFDFLGNLGAIQFDNQYELDGTVKLLYARALEKNTNFY